MIKMSYETLQTQLKLLPESFRFPETEHSEYLQKEFFDKVKDGDLKALLELDFGAFDFCHIIPENSKLYINSVSKSWIEGVNRYFKLVKPVSSQERLFF